MFVYFHGAKTGHNLAMAFHKADKAAEYVINQIDTYIGGKAILGKKSQKKPRPGPALQALYQPQPIHHAPDDDDAGPMPLPADMALNVPYPPPNPPNMWEGMPLPAIYNNGAIDVAAAVAAAVSVAATSASKEAAKNPELSILLAHMEIARKNKTFENAVKAIELYEEYAKYTLSTDAALHTLREIKIVE